MKHGAADLSSLPGGTTWRAVHAYERRSSAARAIKGEAVALLSQRKLPLFDSPLHDIEDVLVQPAARLVEVRRFPCHSKDDARKHPA